MFGKGRHGKKPKIGRKKLIIMVLVAAVAVIFGVKLIGGKNERVKEEVYNTSFVTRGEVTKTISGSGTVEPYERYEVLALVNGEILSAPYDVGDVVEEGAVLYKFDTTDVSLNLQRQENSMEKSA